jgi:hypothetical protein
MTHFLESLTVFVFILFASSVIAQKSFTSTQLLANDLEVELDLLLQNNLQFLKENKQGMPVIDKMEFRTESDRMDFDRQEFLFRMSFNKGQARKVQDEITQNNIKLYETKAHLLDENELEKRYELIVDWHYGMMELKRLEEKKILLEDQRTIYQKMMANALVIDINDLLKTEESLQELERDAAKLEHLKVYAIQQLLPDEKEPTNCELAAASWISIQTMQNVLNENEGLPANNLKLALQQVEVDYSQLEYNMEKAEANKILDFVQLKYTRREKLEVYRQLSLGLALNIPTKSAARVKLNKTQLEVYDEQFKKQLIEANLEEEAAIYFSVFNALVKEYELIQQQISNNNLEETFEKYSAAQEIHPLTLLRIKENILENKRIVKEIEKDACLIFLKILKIKGLLLQTPATNYLSDDLHTF